MSNESMIIRRSPTGVPYLADSTSGMAGPLQRVAMSPLRRIVLFIVVFVALQALWLAAAGSFVERMVIDKATVQVATTWIHLLTPDLPVFAAGPRLTAPGGGINVLKGCEGTDVLFLLLAAFAVADLSWRRRLIGVLLGATLVYLLNQARVVALFYAYRQDKALFDLLHGTLGPLVLVVVVGLFFFAWLQQPAAEPNDQPAV